jgi:hypothetical protein
LFTDQITILFDVFKVPCQSVSTFDFENFDYYHHVSDEFKVMDIGHMTHFIQEMLPAMTKMANSPLLRKTHMNQLHPGAG